jgi:hypothetical protein
VGARAALGEAVDAALASLGRIFAALDSDRVGVLVPAKVPLRPTLRHRPHVNVCETQARLRVV